MKGIQFLLILYHAIHKPVHLGVVDLARPGISRRRDSRGGIAGNVASNAGICLLEGAVVGRHLDRASPVAVKQGLLAFGSDGRVIMIIYSLGNGRGDVVVERNELADVLQDQSVLKIQNVMQLAVLITKL